MITARDIMTQPVTTVIHDTTLETAAGIMIEHRFGCLPVVDGSGELCGIITESSFTAKHRGIPMSTFRAPYLLGRWMSSADAQSIYDEARMMPVSNIMTKSPIVVDPDASLDDIVKKMLDHDINRVVVTDGNKPIGIVARHDLLRMIAKNI